MPQLSYPFVPDGLLVTAVINLAAPVLHAIQDQGNAVPTGIQARGMIDSGSTMTAVVPRILNALNAVPVRLAKITTPAGVYDMICNQPAERR